MTDIEFKVGDLVYDISNSQFGIIYDFDIGEDPSEEPWFEIYWQMSQEISYRDLSILKFNVNIMQRWFHYPVGKQ